MRPQKGLSHHRGSKNYSRVKSQLYRIQCGYGDISCVTSTIATLYLSQSAMMVRGLVIITTGCLFGAPGRPRPGQSRSDFRSGGDEFAKFLFGCRRPTAAVAWRILVADSQNIGEVTSKSILNTKSQHVRLSPSNARHNEQQNLHGNKQDEICY